MKRKYIIAFYIAFIIFGIGLVKLAQSDKTIVKYYEEYQVKSGDTLYKIAAKYPHKDVRKFIYIVKDTNGIDSYIKEGQTILVPILEVD